MCVRSNSLFNYVTDSYISNYLLHLVLYHILYKSTNHAYNEDVIHYFLSMSNTTIVEGNTYDGPWSLSSTTFNEVAGVYLIVDTNGTIVDVGETENLKGRISNHERSGCWSRNGGFNLWFYHEINQVVRLAKEKHIRGTFRPVCGVK